MVSVNNVNRFSGKLFKCLHTVIIGTITRPNFNKKSLYINTDKHTIMQCTFYAYTQIYQKVATQYIEFKQHTFQLNVLFDVIMSTYSPQMYEY